MKKPSLKEVRDWVLGWPGLAWVKLGLVQLGWAKLPGGLGQRTTWTRQWVKSSFLEARLSPVCWGTNTT